MSLVFDEELISPVDLSHFDAADSIQLVLNPISCYRRVVLKTNRLVGLVVKASASRAADISGSSHIRDLRISTAVATLLGAWRYRVSAGVGWPSVSKLWLGEIESLICNFYLSVAACKVVWADLPLRYTSMLLGR